MPVGVLTWMPMSWLIPAAAVQRSALALSVATQLLLGVISSLRLVASMSAQVEPSLLVSEYCALLTASILAPPVGTTQSESRVGELAVPMGPAPATIVPPPERFDFHCSLKL